MEDEQPRRIPPRHTESLQFLRERNRVRTRDHLGRQREHLTPPVDPNVRNALRDVQLWRWLSAGHALLDEILGVLNEEVGLLLDLGRRDSCLQLLGHVMPPLKELVT